MTAGVELARDLIRVDTVNPPGREGAAAAVVAGRLEDAGFDVARHEHAPGRASLVARLAGGESRPAICLTGHLDVVPLGAASWERDPFGGEIDGDRLHGRGSSDMKGGVAAIVVAAERFARTGGGHGAGLEIVLTCGEENGCDGARSLVGSGLLGEVGAVLVAEPTANLPRIAHMGAVWIEASTAGRAAHGSAPERGENAIYPLAAAVASLRSFDFDVAPHPLLGRPTATVGTFHGGENVNSVPDRAVAGIDVRTVPGLDEDDVLAALRATLGEAVELSATLSLPPVVTDPADPWVRDVLDVLASAHRERPAPEGMRPFTDAAILTPAYGGPPTVVCGPGEPDQAHRTDEWCSVARIEQAVEAYSEIVGRWCSPFEAGT